MPGLGVGDEHGGERIAGGRLEGGLPALVDLHLVDQRAEDAGHLGEALRPGSVAGLVERERQRLGPGRPRVLVGFRAAADLLGPRRPALGGDETRGGARLGVGCALLGGLLLRDLAPEAVRVAGHRGGLRLDRGQTGRDALHLGGAALDAGLQRAQLTAHLGGPAGRLARRLRLAPRVVEAGPFVLDLGLDGRDAIELRRDPLGLGVDLGQLPGQLGRLGLEAGDEGLVHQRPVLALDALGPLGQQRGEAAGLLPQRLGAHEVVVDVVAAERGEAGLGAEHVGVERRQPGPERAVLLAEVAPGRGVVVEARLQSAELEAGHVDPQVGQLLDQRAVPAGRVGLALERAAAGGAPPGAGPGAG